VNYRKAQSIVLLVIISLAAMFLVVISLYFMNTGDVVEHGNTIAKSALLVPVGLVIKMFYTHDNGFFFPRAEDRKNKFLSIFVLIILSALYLVFWGYASRAIKDINDFNAKCITLKNNSNITLYGRSKLRSSLLDLNMSIEHLPAVLKNKFLRVSPKECGL
jgi:hypothetical protein